MATSVVGLVFAILWADAEKSKRIDEARAVAEEVGDWFSGELDKALIALYTMRQFVIQTPEFEALHAQIGFCKHLETATSSADCEDTAAPPLKGLVGGYIQPWFS